MPSDLRSTFIDGVFELQSHPFLDSRGAFLNAFRTQDDSFAHSWANRPISQVNISSTKAVGSLRGLHLQSSPDSEAKLVRCLKGRVWDVAVDLRSNSPTFGKWHSVELCPENGNALLIPEGCAHGFQVLMPDSQLLYLHSGAWIAKSETGIRWNDPQLAISWPLPVVGLSSRDRKLPLLSDL